MSEISSPHDRFFKEVFSRQEVARDFLLHYLPKEVLGLLDTESLEVTKDSFVDSELREHLSDLLYKVDLKDGRGAFVYVLFEHKSYPEPRIAFHLLRYMVRIWEQALKQGMVGELHPIIPIVAYHGKAKWKIALDLRALFASPEELRPFLPDFRYVLCDFSRFSDDAIKGMVTLRVALLLMKYIFREDLGERLPEILGLLQELAKKRSGLEYLETVLRYLSHGTDKINAEDLRKAVETALPETGGELMPTIAEKWIEQGVQKGIQQGTLQGIQQGILQTAREDIIEILEVRFEVVARTIVERINGIDDPTILKMLLKKAATVGSLEEFPEVIDRIMG